MEQGPIYRALWAMTKFIFYFIYLFGSSEGQKISSGGSETPEGKQINKKLTNQPRGKLKEASVIIWFKFSTCMHFFVHKYRSDAYYVLGTRDRSKIESLTSQQRRRLRPRGDTDLPKATQLKIP